MREARITSLNTRSAFAEESDEVVLERTRQRIASAALDRPDIILISELFANHPSSFTPEGLDQSAQTVPGPISEDLGQLARKYQTYIAFGLLRKFEARFYNSLVLLDRDGRHVWTYDKVTPMDIEMGIGVTPGTNLDGYQCDFGKIGGAICFDINFLELAEVYSRRGVELVLFSSAFPGGRLIDVWSIRYGMAVAANTWMPVNRILDCTGACVAQTSEAIGHATAVLNLNRRVVHMDGNMDKVQKMREKYEGDILVTDMRGEATIAIESRKPGLEVADLIAEFGVEPLDVYFDRCREIRETCGGLRAPAWMI